MGLKSRRKGAAGEREVVALLRAAGIPCNGRLLGQARDGGGDILAPPYLIEVKRRKDPGPVYSYMEQATAAAAGSDNKPVVFFRADGQSWLVIMRADDFLAAFARQRALEAPHG